MIARWVDGRLEIGDATYNEVGFCTPGIYKLEPTHIGISIRGLNLIYFHHDPNIPFVEIGLLGFTVYIAG